MYCSGKHSLFLYTLTNFDAILHIAVILSITNVLKIWQGSVISFAGYDHGVLYSILQNVLTNHLIEMYGILNQNKIINLEFI
jgi:hypothetical protein